MPKNQNNKYQLLAAFLLMLFLPQLVFAADIFFDAKTTRVQIGEKFEVKLLVNAEQESINALEGKIVFPRDILNLKEIRDGNSIVSFWVDKPKERQGTRDKGQGEVVFSGIIPGGYVGNNGLIFSLIFEAKKEGEGIIEIQNAKALLNDGLGTPTQTTIKRLEFVVIRGDIRGDSWSVPKDTYSPETFRPEIARDETLFDGKWFLVFATQDKASGIDHYEVKESRQRVFTLFQKWSRAESPHVLRDQELRSFIFAKAVDKAGNKRIAHIAPRNPLSWYKNYESWIMIIVGALAMLVVTKKLWRKKRT